MYTLGKFIMSLIRLPGLMHEMGKYSFISRSKSWYASLSRSLDADLVADIFLNHNLLHYGLGFSLLKHL